MYGEKVYHDKGSALTALAKLRITDKNAEIYRVCSLDDAISFARDEAWSQGQQNAESYMHLGE